MLTTLSSLFLSRSFISTFIKRFSVGTFKAHFIKCWLITRYFCKFRGGEIPSWSIQNGREPQGYSNPQYEQHGKLNLHENLLFHGAKLADSVGWCCPTVTSQAWGPQSKRRCFFSVLGGEKRVRISLQYSLCWLETYAESIRKLMQHKYHMVSVHLLLYFNGRQQNKQHRWLHLWLHSLPSSHFVMLFDCCR